MTRCRATLILIPTHDVILNQLGYCKNKCKQMKLKKGKEKRAKVYTFLNSKRKTMENGKRHSNIEIPLAHSFVFHDLKNVFGPPPRF